MYWLNSFLKGHILNEWTYFTILQYPCIVFFLFLYEWKHNSLSFPIFDPQIERTNLLNSSLISSIFLSTVPTKLAADGCSQTKSWFRMWSMDWIMFFCTSFNVSEVNTTSVNFVAFSILSCNFLLLLVIEINPCLWIDSRNAAKGLVFQKVMFSGVSGVNQKWHYYLPTSKDWK